MKEENGIDISESEVIETLAKHAKEFEKIEKKDVNLEDIINVMNNMTCYFFNAHNAGKIGCAKMYNVYYKMAREKLIEICPKAQLNYVESLRMLIR